MWTAEFAVKFTPVPPEMEEAYWFAIHYLAHVMFDDLLKEQEYNETSELSELGVLN